MRPVRRRWNYAAETTHCGRNSKSANYPTHNPSRTSHSRRIHSDNPHTSLGAEHSPVGDIPWRRLLPAAGAPLRSVRGAPLPSPAATQSWRPPRAVRRPRSTFVDSLIHWRRGELGSDCRAAGVTGPVPGARRLIDGRRAAAADWPEAAAPTLILLEELHLSNGPIAIRGVGIRVPDPLRSGQTKSRKDYYKRR